MSDFGNRNGPGIPLTGPAAQSLIDQAKEEIRKELFKKFAGWIITGGIGFLGLAILGAWVILKPVISPIIGSLPDGAVVAFDLETCPAPWSTFKPGTGRVIVGQGRAYDGRSGQDFRGQALAAYNLHDIGGSQVYNIEIADLPEELKSVQVVGSSDSAIFSASIFDKPGPSLFRGAKPRKFSAENSAMPPYYALSYCKKG